MKSEKIQALFSGERVVAKADSFAKALYDKSRFGELYKKEDIQYSFVEALFLLEQDKMEVLDGKYKPISFDKFLKKLKKFESNLWIRYCVFKDMRERGYIVKTALKFGADFRVYDRGIKPGEDHAKWILYAIHEGASLTWHEFSAKNRVAHSTKKNLLIGIVDEENDVTYYEVKWVRP
ncbi:MAG: tRNA-intron lyase [Nanoarchaeota archaeon]